MRSRDLTPDEAGFTEFVAARQQPLLRAARLLTGNAADAEELLQESLARCVPVWARIADDPEPYVRTVMVRQNISRWRRRRVTEVAEPVGESWHPHAASSSVEERDRLVAALAQLPARQRTAVVLRHVEDRSEREVAEMMRCTVGTVKSQTHAGLARLRHLLDSASLGAVPELSRSESQPF